MIVAVCLTTAIDFLFLEILFTFTILLLMEFTIIIKIVPIRFQTSEPLTETSFFFQLGTSFITL